MRVFAACVAAAALLVPAAIAKDFQPGDLFVCGKGRCVSIEDRSLLRLMSTLYWGPGLPARAPRVRPGSSAFQLRWPNGYVSGIVASGQLDRFRPYGFYCGRFRKGAWYRVPPRAAAALRAMTHGMRPRSVPAVPPSFC